MVNIKFEAELSWNGTGKDGEGRIKMNKESVRYSSPAEMGGKGAGVSPEDLLLGAVSSCYSGTLYSLLAKKKLSVSHISVKAEGIVTGYPAQMKFSRITVYPTIYNGDETRKKEYQEAVEKARNKCFIGKTIAGNVDYEVGSVQFNSHS